MVECPYCFRGFRREPEDLGSRCPKCRMPLFEGSSKKRRPERDLGNCARHPEVTAVATCKRCARPMCHVCRTRWHEEPICPECLEASLQRDEPTALEKQQQLQFAWTSFASTATAVFLLLTTLWLTSTFYVGDVSHHQRNVAGFFFFAALVPLFVALGRGVCAVRLRGNHAALATSALVSAGGLLGLTLGLVILGIWHN